MNKNVEVLEKVLEVLEEEKRSFYALINQNDFRIEEINSYLKDLSKKEDEDFKVFSPRNVENTHREQIEADVYEKKKYEEENAEYQKKIDFLKSLIDRVNIVIENLQTDINFSGISEKEEVKIKEEREVSKESIIEEKEKNLRSVSFIELENKAITASEKQHIAHQIINCVSFITSDAERTKIELTALAKKLKN